MASADRLRILVAGVLTATLAACGNSGTGNNTGSDTGGGHDDADVAFATSMIPHHAQAIAMSKLAATNAARADVKRLATQISAEQGPDIYLMQSLLSDWGRPAAPTASGMPGMGSMALGMLTDQQMAQLTSTTGPAFDRMFLQLMILHDQGGIEMANTELADGRDADASTLAQNIKDAQEYAIPLLQHLIEP